MDTGKKSSGLSKSCILIIVVASVERFAYKGVASNLVTYLTNVVKMSNSSAAKSVNSWCGVTSMLPLVGAFLADSYWDRYSTILASSLIYILGLVALTSSALLWVWTTASKNTMASSSSFFCSLYLISLGQGGYNPCLQAFGADQLENENLLDDCNKEDDGSKKKSSYFQWWYFGICTGSLLGVTVMSYIQDTFGWVLGFAIPTVAMASSVACFTCATRFFIPKISKVAEDKPTENIFQLIKPTLTKFVTTTTRLGFSPKDSNADSDAVELELQNRPLGEDFDRSKFFGNKPTDEIPVDVARVVLRLMPVWTTLLMFAVIFQQPLTFFTKQGMTMQRNIGNHFVIPPATLQSAITISIILLMPLYDKLIIPITMIFTRDKRGINVQQRMGIGMFLSIIAMVVAALVESKRIEISRRIGRVSQPQPPTVQLSILWLLPQYILLGISDIFTVVGMQEFFYSQVPNTMRTMGIALYLSVFGVGSFLSAFLITLVETITGICGQKQSWFSDDMTEARLDNYYWLLAVSSTLSFLMFVKLSKCYKD